MTQKIDGYQVGLSNCADELSGFQLGLSNNSEKLNGVQIGLIFQAGSGKFKQFGLLTIRIRDNNEGVVTSHTIMPEFHLRVSSGRPLIRSSSWSLMGNLR